MAEAQLTGREEKILATVIEDYVRTAKPVSSSAVVERSGLGVSSATVRNVMRALEDRGLIMQPHTSAGRIPADDGYRYYVDRLMGPVRIPDGERTRLTAELTVLRGHDLATILTEVSRVVSTLTHQLAVGLEPAIESSVIERMELVPLDGTRCLAAVSMRSGQTRSVVFECAGAIDFQTVRAATELLNGWAAGLSVGEAARELSVNVSEDDCPFAGLLTALIDCWPDLFHLHDSGRVHYEGARYILKHPEFAEDASLLGEILDSEEALADLVRSPAGPKDVTVTIGRENRRRTMRGVSLIVGSYRVGATVGRIGVIGPTRMRYRRLVGLVGHLSGLLDDFFSSDDWPGRR
ncbi:heat-inducible transcriptional repressor HrcA [bacterium]|nr:heat-inducible transcriptional repressor HrcA [bacterium]